MHPIPTSRLAYNLASRSESSFPERHAWSEPDDISHLASSSSSMNNDVTYAQQPGFPKIDIFAPGLSSFWQQNWLDQSQPLMHHRHPHSNDRIITSPQAHTTLNHHHHHHHEFFTPSPISPIQPSDTPAQTEWDILRETTVPDGGHPFPWVPSQAPPQSQSHNPITSDPKIKIEDDSDSNWSLNDSLELEDAHLPPLLIQPTINLQRLRRGSLGGPGRVSKLARLPATTRPVYQTFRVGKRTTTTTASSSTTVDLSGSGNTSYEVGVAEATGDLSPDDYAAKVQERRIAHKLSEKSRRNRLTAAIREIQKLMPAEKEKETVTEKEREQGEGGMVTGEGQEQDHGGEMVVQPHFSKVDVVEMAVGFIRKLKQDNERLAAKVRKAEKARAGHRDQEEERGRDDAVAVVEPDAVEGT